ncbi:MAG TPA: tetratricopeptide repeat protein, partial [Pyrinomonadaceae bacterium]|nr:tetratricopeptide repeat protein [Pyrinomonadaceae bacterium]
MDLNSVAAWLGGLFLIAGQFCVWPAAIFASSTADAEVVFNNARQASLTWQADEAVQQYMEAATLFAAAGDHDRSAKSTLLAAETAYAAGDQIKARALVEGAISHTSRLSSDMRIVAYSILALISYQAGKKVDAERWCRDSQSLITSGTSNEASAYSHFSCGIYEYFFGDVRKASTSFEEAVRLTTDSEEPFVSTQSLFYSGYSQLRLGNTLPAMNRMQEALARSQQMGYERGIALAYREIGYIHFYLGERQTALDSFRTAERMFPETGAVVELARVFNAIGLVYRDFGDLVAAERYFEDAERTFVSADYPLGELTALLNRSDVYTRAGSNDRARESYLLAQERAEELGDEFQMAMAAEGLGKLELNSKNFDKAIVRFKAALALTETSRTDSNTISELLGAAYELNGDLKNARTQYDSVLAINDRMGNTVNRAKNLFDLARVDYLEGKFQASHDRMVESLGLTEKVYASVDSSSLRRSYLGQSHYRFELMTALTARDANASQRPEDIELALMYLEKARSRSLSDDLRLTRAGISTNADQGLISKERYLLASLTAKTDRLTNMRLKNPSDPDVSVVESEISKILEELDEISTVQKQQDPLYSSIRKPPDFELAPLQREALGSDEVLIAYFLSESESYVWLADKTKIELYRLPEGGLINRAVDSLNEKLQTRADVDDLQPEK